MATSKLQLFNGCLGELGDERLSDTGDPIKAARELVYVYTQVVDECLAAGSWNFAMEDVSLTGDTGLITDRVGYRYGFSKPSDWVRTIAVSEDEYFNYPHTQYYDDGAIFKADNTPLYLRYVSDDTGLGYDLASWPANFARFVELELADRVCMRLTQNASLKETVAKARDKARQVAKNQDAMDSAQPKFRPPNSWTQARWGRSGGRDRGSRGSLIG